MKKDATFKWDDKDFVSFYTDSANFIVLERQRSIRILLEIVAFHFPSLSGLHILDLGCGEGIITKYIYDKSPSNNFYLLDASEEMLNKAKANLLAGGAGPDQGMDRGGAAHGRRREGTLLDPGGARVSR